MATVTQLGTRVLGKLKILDPTETPNAADQAKAEEKIRAAHALIKGEGLLQWTLSDIPDFAEEPYVLIASALAADDFNAPKDADWIALGVRLIQRGVYLPIPDNFAQAENF